MSHLPRALRNSRCILHIDLDCFFCQVEQVRLGIPTDVPAAVQQWQGLIAVNYAARKAGVKKMTNVAEARKLCPDIRLLHVATLAANDTEPHYYSNPGRNTHKVSLDAYRNASKAIFKIFHKYCDSIQKIGTDEGFMDVTKTINQRLMDRYINKMPDLLDKMDDEVCGVFVNWEQLGFTIESKEEEERRLNHVHTDDGTAGSHWEPTTWSDLQLALGAELAAEIRKEIYDKLKYTCSAGIAHYKVVAKLCSNKNKPNKQTVLRNTARIDFMRDIPFKKIRNLGGKLGNEVGSDLEVLSASELWKYSVEDLQERFGESTGMYLYDICRGIDNEEVTPTKAPKSLMAAKTFTLPIKRPQDMERWFSILSVELHGRIMSMFEEHGTWPKSISLRYATERVGVYKSKSIGTIHKDEMKTHEILYKKFAALYNSLEDAYPCIGIDLCASGLVEDESSKSHTINQFFTKSKDANAHHANGTTVELKHNKQQDYDEKKPTSRASFFNNNKQASTSQETETYVCDKCNQLIPIVSVEEHSDYHFALDLLNQDRQQQQQQSPPQQQKRKAKTTTKEEEKKLKRSLFFQPKKLP